MKKTQILIGALLLAGCTKDEGSKGGGTPVPDPVNSMTDIVGTYKGRGRVMVVSTITDYNGVVHIDTSYTNSPDMVIAIKKIDNFHFSTSYQNIFLEDTLKYQGLSYYQDNSVNDIINTRNFIFTPDRDSLSSFSVLTLEVTGDNPLPSKQRFESYTDFQGVRD